MQQHKVTQEQHCLQPYTQIKHHHAVNFENKLKLKSTIRDIITELKGLSIPQMAQ